MNAFSLSPSERRGTNIEIGTTGDASAAAPANVREVVADNGRSRATPQTESSRATFARLLASGALDASSLSDESREGDESSLGVPSATSGAGDESLSSDESGAGDESSLGVPSATSRAGDYSSLRVASDESWTGDKSSASAGSWTGDESVPSAGSGTGHESLSSAGSSTSDGSGAEDDRSSSEASTTGDELSLSDALGAGEETGLVAELEAQLDASDERRNRLVDRLEEELQAQREDFNARALELEGNNADLLGQVAELEAQREASDARALELEGANADLRGQVARLDAQLKASKEEVEKHFLWLQDAEVEKADLRRRLGAAEARAEGREPERQAAEANAEGREPERHAAEARAEPLEQAAERQAAKASAEPLEQAAAASDQKIAEPEQEKDDQPKEQEEASAQEIAKEADIIKKMEQERDRVRKLTKDSYFKEYKTLLGDEDYIAMFELLCGDLVRVGGQKDQTEAAMNVIVHSIGKEWLRTDGNLPICPTRDACIRALESRFPGLKAKVVARKIQQRVADRFTRDGARQNVEAAKVAPLPPRITPLNIHAEGPEGASCVNGDDLCVSKQNGQRPRFFKSVLTTGGTRSDHDLMSVVCEECTKQKRKPVPEPSFGNLCKLEKCECKECQD